jgi:hypothetical protein
MATLEQVTEAHARRQKQLAKRTAEDLHRLWRLIDPSRIGESWRLMLPQALGLLATSQARAAASAGIYVDDALEAQGLHFEPEGRVISTSLAGIASDGRNLTSLMFEPAIQTLSALKQGQPYSRANAVGLLSLDKISRTQVADAGRGGESIAITARPQVQGYVRMLSLPSCSRCVILAGKFFRWNAGFRRHPRCDCRHIPSRENVAGDLLTDPKKAFDEMPAAEQDRVFTKAGATAIREGADMNQVVNARRGMETAVVFGQKVKITKTNARRGRPRLMPEQILIEAKGNRVEAIRLMRLHGYLN